MTNTQMQLIGGGIILTGVSWAAYRYSQQNALIARLQASGRVALVVDRTRQDPGDGPSWVLSPEGISRHARSVLRITNFIGVDDAFIKIIDSLPVYSQKSIAQETLTELDEASGGVGSKVWNALPDIPGIDIQAWWTGAKENPNPSWGDFLGGM